MTGNRLNSYGILIPQVSHQPKQPYRYSEYKSYAKYCTCRNTLRPLTRRRRTINHGITEFEVYPHLHTRNTSWAALSGVIQVCTDQNPNGAPHQTNITLQISHFANQWNTTGHAPPKTHRLLFIFQFALYHCTNNHELAADTEYLIIGHLLKFNFSALAALFSCSAGHLYCIKSLPPRENALRSSRKLHFRRCLIFTRHSDSKRPPINTEFKFQHSIIRVGLDAYIAFLRLI